MIEHKFFNINKYKNIEDAAKELDRLMMYEGFIVLCCVGKRNNVLLLRRILESPEEELPTKNKRAIKNKAAMFPNAVYS